MALSKNEYKNWKELCEEMGWKTTGGNYMDARKKELNSICRCHKEGQKIIIDEVFKVKKITTIGKGSNVDYVRIIKLFVMDKLASSDKEKIALSKSRLLSELDIVNFNYNECMKHPYKFAKSEDLKVENVFDFKNSTRDMIRKNLEKALNSLVDSKLISWHKGYNIITGNMVNIAWDSIDKTDFEGNTKRKASVDFEINETHIELNEDEENIMRNCERLTLIDLRFIKENEDNLGVVYKAGKLGEFYKKTIEKFKEMTVYDNVVSYYPTYVVRFDKQLIEQGKKSCEEYMIDKLSKEEYVVELNEAIKKRITENAKKRKANNSKGKYSYRSEDKYLNDIRNIADITIDKTAEYIVKKVLKVKLIEEQIKQELLEELNQID
ncbi:hypothetical protein CDLVIII_3192 [Clostridium sp. DL-VIII]|uniref:hypothetical protein n=1 Tax=Clostridium sp. DL-VIII TaxID=641107 RepID=UPI00023AFFC5|nr:hypothetical protein [Clostridium sp. DL-VIII]EHI99766.1 hypothetical protein CDLVIII_3192 [Clostridium sp. DL-VIII]